MTAAARRTLAFLAGLLLVSYEAVWQDGERPLLLTLYATMMGLSAGLMSKWRRTLAFLEALALTVFEAVDKGGTRPFLLTLYAAMMGFPLLLGPDGYKPESPAAQKFLKAVGLLQGDSGQKGE